MPAFSLTPGAWVQVVAPGGTKDQQVQVNHGRALISFGTPEANSSPLVGSTVENKITIAPAGVEVQARALDAAATITTGDY